MMKISARAFVALMLFALITPNTVVGSQDDTAELDAYWDDVRRTVITGDLAGMTALYHSDAVLVSESSNSSVPIQQALANWAPGLARTRDGETEANVEFRFTQRLHDETTAHETGIFRHSAEEGSEEAVVVYIHFEALMVKTDGWLMLMEYQKSPATVAEWNGAE